MLIEIDDDYRYEILVKILKKDRDDLKEYLEIGNYWMEEDRHYDERLLAALDVVIHNYDIPEIENVNGSE